MPAPADVVELLERFRRNLYSYRSPSYNETQLRREFVDPLFECLGWDLNNKRGYAEAYKDVVHEDSVRVEGVPRSPDYSFRVGGVRKFFVETKKPSVNLKDDPSPAFQLRRYGWSAKLPISILTDFEEFAVYDTRILPKVGDTASAARIDYLHGEEIVEHWDERVAGRFSYEAVVRGDFDRFASPSGKRRGTAEVDDAFLNQINDWRKSLARVLALRNQDLTTAQLNYAVQITIDRIVFLRIAEDRGIEQQGQLLEIAKRPDAYEGLLDLFRLADDRYNSGLFHFRTEKNREKPDNITPKLGIDDKTIKQIIEGLYYPKSPYEFSVLPADILGHVYERFLGEVIRLTPAHTAVIEEKPEVRKAGGVYYTPTFVVRHIVRTAVATQLEGKTPRQIANFRVLDPACGSGSFLLDAYQFLLDWYQGSYIADGADKWSKTKEPRLRPSPQGWRLTTSERKRILLAHVFGVDIDPQAVEVTKLSLLLKVLEGETNHSIEQMNLLHDRALPDLGRNIKRGNSLIETDFLDASQFELLDDARIEAVNPFDWGKEFPEVFKDGGFDAVIGNPPYVLLQGEFRDDAQLDYFKRKYRAAAFKVDTYHLFMERGLSLTKSGGLVSMITPSNFITNNHLAGLRRILLEKSRIRELMVVEGGVFPGISVDNAIFALEAGKATGKQFEIVHALPVMSQDFHQISTAKVLTKTALADKHVLFTGAAGKDVSGIWNKVESRSKPLGALADVNFGKQLRDRSKFTKDVVEVPSLAAVPRGYRPCYTGKNVGRYHVEWDGLACLNNTVAQSGGCWDSAKQDAKNKLLTKQIGQVPEFAIDTAGHQCLNTMFMINLRGADADPLVVLAQLNARITHALWLDKYYDRRRTFPKIKGTYLKHLPIFVFDPSDKAHQAALTRIHETVARVIKLRNELAGSHDGAKDERIQRQLGGLEGAIDKEFYALYGLTDADVGVIDGILAAALAPNKRGKGKVAMAVLP